MKGTVGVLCAVTLMLTACAGEAAQETSDAADVAPTTSTTAPTDREVVSIAVSPCDLVSTDEVAAATGLDVAESRAEPPISCLFDFGPEAGVAIFVSIDDGEGRFGAPAAVVEDYSAMVAEGTAELVPGLGAAAVYSQGYRGLAVDAGDGRFLAFGVNGGYGELAEPRDALIALAAAALGRL